MRIAHAFSVVLAAISCTTLYAQDGTVKTWYGGGNNVGCADRNPVRLLLFATAKLWIIVAKIVFFVYDLEPQCTSASAPPLGAHCPRMPSFGSFLPGLRPGSLNSWKPSLLFCDQNPVILEAFISVLQPLLTIQICRAATLSN